MLEAKAKADQIAATREKTQLDFQSKMASLAQKREEAMSRIDMEHMRALAEIGRAMLQNHHESGMQAREHHHDFQRSALDHERGMFRDDITATRNAAMQRMQPQGAQA